MMAMMQGGGAGMMADPSAVPFAMGQEVADDDPVLNADIIRPSLLESLVKEQEGGRNRFGTRSALSDE